MIYEIDNAQDLWGTVKDTLYPTKTLVDIGCGEHYHDELYPRAEHIICTDVYKSSLDKIKNSFSSLNIDSTFAVLHASWQKINDSGLLYTVDKPLTITLMDVIEHLQKEEAIYLINEAVKVADQILIFTPLGFMPQHINGLPHQEHISGWEPSEFTEDGWNCYVHPKFHSPYGAFFALYQR